MKIMFKLAAVVLFASSLLAAQEMPFHLTDLGSTKPGAHLATVAASRMQKGSAMGVPDQFDDGKSISVLAPLLVSL